MLNENAHTKYIHRIEAEKILNPQQTQRLSLVNSDTINFDLTSALSKGNDNDIGAKNIMSVSSAQHGVKIVE